MTSAPCRLPLEVVVPVRWTRTDRDEAATRALAAHLALLAACADVTVVDGSPEPLRRAHVEAWSPWARILEPLPAPLPGPANGKVLGALAGVLAARHDAVVLADDDVRHSRATLAALLEELHDADLVLPLNISSAWPWQARWDGARTLLNVAVATDWPGTVALRAGLVRRAGGWDPGVLFENLELARTVAAAGGTVRRAPWVVVPREPPEVDHFVGQRMRQAYDDLAQPGRLALEAAVLPAFVYAGWRRPAFLLAAAGALVALAARGRRLAGADRVPADVPLWAPLWALERGVSVWLALGSRLRGGVRYHGERLRTAAHSTRDLEARLAPVRGRPGGLLGRGGEPAEPGEPTEPGEPAKPGEPLSGATRPPRSSRRGAPCRTGRAS